MNPRHQGLDTAFQGPGQVHSHFDSSKTL